MCSLIMAGISVGQTFSTFTDASKAIETLKNEGHHPLRVFNSQSGSDYNKKRLSRKFPGIAVDVTKFQYTYYSVRCVHYGHPRQRGKGLRPNQRAFSLGCEAKITLSYDKFQDKLVVREVNLEHNHRVGQEIIKHYPSFQRLETHEEEELLNIVSLKPNNKHVRDMVVKKYGKYITLKDIHNLKTKVRERSQKGLEDAQLLLDNLKNTLEKDKGANAGITVDEENTIAIVYYQSSAMARIMKKFPEILFIDGTYNVNRVGMPQYCLMVEDGFGHGYNCFYAATAQEDSMHLQRILTSFKENNESWQHVSVVIIDKDFTEHKVLKEEFPEAVILYCQWHVIKALFKAICDYDIDKDDREVFRGLIRSIVHAKDLDQYNELKEELYSMSSKQFQQYFEINWDHCRSMWATFERDQHLHYGNTTNNRLESHNQKLKDLTARSSSLSEMFQSLILYSSTVAAEYSYTAFKEEFTVSLKGDDIPIEASKISKICTAYAADLVIKQVKLAKSVSYNISHSEVGVTVVTFKDKEYIVSEETGNCTCSLGRRFFFLVGMLFLLEFTKKWKLLTPY